MFDNTHQEIYNIVSDHFHDKFEAEDLANDLYRLFLQEYERKLKDIVNE